MSRLLGTSILFLIFAAMSCNKASQSGAGGRGANAVPPIGGNPAGGSPSGGTPGGAGEVNCTGLSKEQCQAKINQLPPGITPVPYREVKCPTATKEDPNCQALIKQEQDLGGGLGEIRVKTCADDATIPGCALSGGGGTILDFKACASAAGRGLHDGYGKCGSNEVMTLINDGEGKEFTCCRLTANDVLSPNSGDRYIERGTCGTDEVGVGMKSLSTAYCSKLNATLYTSTVIGTTVIVYPETSWLDASLKALVDSYGYGDTCICRDGGVVSGNHSSTNGVCADKCVQIKKK